MKQKKIEDEIRKKELAKNKERERTEFFLFTKDSNQQYLDQELKDWEREESTRKSLIQDVINEAAEDGNPLSKPVMKLIDYFKGKFYY